MKKSILISAKDADFSKKLQIFFASLDGADEAEIRFEKGEYRFRKEDCAKRFVYSGCSPNGEKNIVFPIENARNLTVDGGGADFVFCDRVSPFLIQGCENVTLKNFTMDFSFLRYAFAEVKEISDAGLSLSIREDLFDYFVKDGHLFFVCGSETIGTSDCKISMKRITRSATDTYFFYAVGCRAPRNTAASAIVATVQKTDAGVFLAYEKESERPDFSVGDTVCLAYDNDRENRAFYAVDSKNILLQNVSLYRNGGMGFVADTCESITLDGFRLALKEGREEYYSSTADAIFLTNCTGDCILRNSEIRDTYDDAMNVHGYYTRVEESLSQTRVRLSFARPSHYGLIPYRVGDVLTVSDMASGNELGETAVTAVFVNEDRSQIEIETDGKIALAVGMCFENKGRMPRLLVENNVVANCPHLRLSAPCITVRNNHLDLTHASVLIHDLFTFWGENGAITSAEIYGNRFGKCGVCGISAQTCRPQGTNHIHGRIEIYDNDFEMPKSKALQIEACRNLIERNNRFGVK